MGYVPPCFWFEDNFSFGVTNYTSNATGANIFDILESESFIHFGIAFSFICILTLIFMWFDFYIMRGN